MKPPKETPVLGGIRGQSQKRTGNGDERTLAARPSHRQHPWRRPCSACDQWFTTTGDVVCPGCREKSVGQLELPLTYGR